MTLIVLHAMHYGPRPNKMKILRLAAASKPYHMTLTNPAIFPCLQYWDQHCSTLSKLPAVALLDQSSCPRGMSDADFLRVMCKLTDAEAWQIWDLHGILDRHSCNYVSRRCPKLYLRSASRVKNGIEWQLDWKLGLCRSSHHEHAWSLLNDCSDRLEQRNDFHSCSNTMAFHVTP